MKHYSRIVSLICQKVSNIQFSSHNAEWWYSHWILFKNSNACNQNIAEWTVEDILWLSVHFIHQHSHKDPSVCFSPFCFIPLWCYGWWCLLLIGQTLQTGRGTRTHTHTKKGIKVNSGSVHNVEMGKEAICNIQLIRLKEKKRCTERVPSWRKWKW